MSKYKRTGFLILATACLACVLALPAAWMLVAQLRPAPQPLERQLFQGITYRRQVTSSPRPMVIHLLVVDLQTPGIQFLVTPADTQAERPLQARTTSRFLDEFNLQAAINGDGFTPWYANHPLSYYPHPGDPVAPIGFAASRGEIYAKDTDREPTLYISRTNRASFRTPTGRIYNAISGNLMLVEAGSPAALPVLEDGSPVDSSAPNPRTAIGLDKSGRRLILMVVDGRQPGYSQGATLEELVQLLIGAGAHNAMNLDGGGSSTLAVQDENGRPRLLNVPIHTGLPGWERPVGNHLGIFAEPLP